MKGLVVLQFKENEDNIVIPKISYQPRACEQICQSLHIDRTISPRNLSNHPSLIYFYIPHVSII